MIDKALNSGELVAAFIEKRITDNLEAFKEHLPDVYENFKDYRERNIFLIYDVEGNINLIDRKTGKLHYGDNAVAECINNFENYKKEPILRPFSVKSSKVAWDKDDAVNYVHNKFMREIGDCQVSLTMDSFREASSNLLTTFKSGEEIKENWFQFPKNIGSMVLFSTGLGFDLEKLYLDHDIRNLYILEPDSDVFFASIQLIDWKLILEKCKDKSMNINIIISDKFDEIYSSFSSRVRFSGVHKMAGAYLYSSFYKEEYKAMYEKIKNLINYDFLNGYGFYDDARYSIAHTVANFRNNRPLFDAGNKRNKQLGQALLPVAIIGSGPSLDNDLNYLRNNQDSLVVVSCGSSLPAVLKNGIVPDYHFELERTASIPYWIYNSSDCVDGFYDKLKEITLIQISHVHPLVSEMFGKTGLTLKDSEVGSLLLNYCIDDKKVTILPNLAPTCVHAAVSTMIAMGFRSLHLFGVDMGSTDPELHHSKHSNYHKLPADDFESRKFKAGATVFKSNFGEKEVFSSGNYPMFKHVMENIVRDWRALFKDLGVYNCSDGALFEGIQPLRADDISLSIIDNKKGLIDDVFRAHFSLMPEPYMERLDSSLKLVKSEFSSLCLKASKAIKDVKSIDEAYSLIGFFSDEFHSEKILKDELAWLYTLFDGTLLYILSCIHSSMNLPYCEDKILDSINDEFMVMKEYFNEMHNDFVDNCEKPDSLDRYTFFDSH